MSVLQLNFAQIISDAEKRQERENFADSNNGLQAYIEYGVLLQSLSVAARLLEETTAIPREGDDEPRLEKLVP